MNELDLQQKMKRKKLTPGYSAQARRQNEAQDRLHSGIRTGVRVDDLQGFLGQGATVNGRSFHVTPLFESAIAGRLDCIKMLVEAGAEVYANDKLHAKAIIADDRGLVMTANLQAHGLDQTKYDVQCWVLI